MSPIPLTLRPGPARCCSRLLVVLLMAYTLMACAEQGQAQGETAASADKEFARVTLNGNVINAEIVLTREDQARGLSGRSALAPDEGMLFVYAEAGNYRFWMKDMLIPIDIVWINNFRIVHIEAAIPPPAPGTPTSDLIVYESAEPANFVLEIAAGRAQEVGVGVGDRVRFDFN